MSKSALLDMIGAEQRKVIMHEEDGKHRVETRQDVTHIIKAAKDMWSDNPPLDMRRVALIPKAVLDEALNDGWFHDPEAWRKWANSSQNAQYRTCAGTI